MPGFLATLAIAAVIGKIADMLVRESISDGFWMHMLPALLGAWIGAYMPVFNTMGPYLLGIALIPTILTSAVFVFFFRLFKYTVKQNS